MSLKDMLINIGMTDTEAEKIRKDTLQLREDLAEHHGCTVEEAQERFLRLTGEL